ncbi:MAG TPA: radical SAM protein [Candidatus Bathyarchaeota archaeon]|nr:radical SAM protein [Candidatus Bathyarchaeota archaeon]
MAKTIYGPVISWRLGRSLGVDPILPPKTCTFDCVYCQLGRTIHKIGSPGDFEPKVHVEDVIADLEEALRAGLDLGLVDYITFSGCGEPTLHPELGDMIRAVRGACPGVPIAILSNASLLWLDGVLEGAREADFLVAKLDAPDSTVLRAVNRPARGITHELVVEGLRKAREAMRGHGKLAIQVMLLKAHGRPLNYELPLLAKLADVIREVAPDQVQVNTPTRPPAEAYVEPLGQGELEEAAAFLRSRLEDLGVEVVHWHRPSPGPTRPTGASLRDAITSVLERRPCRFHELCSITGREPMAVRAELDRLLSDGLLATKSYRGERFYYLKGH